MCHRQKKREFHPPTSPFSGAQCSGAEYFPPFFPDPFLSFSRGMKARGGENEDGLGDLLYTVVVVVVARPTGASPLFHPFLLVENGCGGT